MDVFDLLDAKLHPLDITVTWELITELMEYFMPKITEKTGIQKEYLASIKRKPYDEEQPNRTRRGSIGTSSGQLPPATELVSASGGSVAPDGDPTSGQTTHRGIRGVGAFVRRIGLGGPGVRTNRRALPPPSSS